MPGKKDDNEKMSSASLVKTSTSQPSTSQPSTESQSKSTPSYSPPTAQDEADEGLGEWLAKEDPPRKKRTRQSRPAPSVSPMQAPAVPTTTLNPDSLTDEDIAQMAFNPSLAAEISEAILGGDMSPTEDGIPELRLSTGDAETLVSVIESMPADDEIGAALRRMGLPITKANRQMLMYGPDGMPDESELL